MQGGGVVPVVSHHARDRPEDRSLVRGGALEGGGGGGEKGGGLGLVLGGEEVGGEGVGEDAGRVVEQGPEDHRPVPAEGEDLVVVGVDGGEAVVGAGPHRVAPTIESGRRLSSLHLSL